MASGFECTLDTLVATSNLAALDLLLELAVRGPEAYRDFALETLLTRRDRDLLFGLVRNFHDLTETQQKRLLLEGARLSNAIRRGYLDQDPVVYKNACTLIRVLPDFEQVSLLVGALMKDSPRKADAVALLRDLADKLSVAEVRAANSVSPIVRRHFIQALRDGMRRYVEHRTDAVPEAFLLVSDEDAAEVRKILHTASDPCHNAVVRILRRSDNPKVLRWIYWMLRTRQPPAAVLNIIADRDDPIFVQQLLDRIGIHVEPVVAASLGLIREVRWLEPDHRLLPALPEPLQAAGVAFAMKTGVPLEQKLELAAWILDEGHRLARQITAHSLAELPGADASRLIQACLEDPDPEIQLAATLQLRRRGLPNSLALLIRQLDSEDDRIRAASQQSLSDYTMSRFLRIYEKLDDSARSAVGRAIVKIDPNSLSTLRAEMKASHRQQKTRAARIVRSLNLSDELAPELMVMLGDGDYMVRREAIESLAYVTQTKVVEVLAAYGQKGHELSAGAANALEYLQRAARHPAVREAALQQTSKLASGN